MADIQHYKKELARFNSGYTKEALKEPANLWGLAGFAVASAFMGSVIPLLIGLLAEFVYVLAVPNLEWYRRIVNKRFRETAVEDAKTVRERLISSFTPREREAVEYLRWQKDRIIENYQKFTGSTNVPPDLLSLEQRWEDFIDLLDVYRRRKQHLKSINRQAIHNQLSQAFRSMESAPDEKTRRVQETNVEILKRRLASFDDIEKSVSLVEAQLQSIENFFGYLNDEIVSITTPEKFSLLDFRQLSDSIAMTKQMLEETADSVGALDSFNRENGNYDFVPDGKRR